MSLWHSALLNRVNIQWNGQCTFLYISVRISATLVGKKNCYWCNKRIKGQTVATIWFHSEKTRKEVGEAHIFFFPYRRISLLIIVLKFPKWDSGMSECLCIYLTNGKKRKKPEFFCSPGSETKETALYFPQKCEMDFFTLKTLSCSPYGREGVESRMKIWGASCHGGREVLSPKMFLERFLVFFEGERKESMSVKNSLTLQNF